MAEGVWVVGAGGIGCALAHALRAGGVDVTLVESDPAKVAWAQEHGVGIVGQSCLPINVVAFEHWNPPTTPSGIVFLSTKCYDNQTVLSRLDTRVEIIPVQNGFDRQLMARAKREGVASFVSECNPGQTQTRITRKGELHIGSNSSGSGSGMNPLLGRVTEALTTHGAFKVRQVRDVRPFKYAKVMYNAAISPLAAVTGFDNSKLLTLKPARRLFFRFLQENYRILSSAAIPLGKVGPFHPQTVNRILTWPLVARSLALPFSISLRNTYCSMSGDIEKGQTEIRNFNGHLIDLAGAEPCDLNRRACDLVDQMAAERAKPSVAYLNALTNLEAEGGLCS